MIVQDSSAREASTPIQGSSRRQSIQTVSMLGAATVVAGTKTSALTDDTGSAEPEKVPRRRLGKSEAEISALGIGAHHLGDFANVDEAIQVIHTALDAGINFFDNCSEYYYGLTETILGRALKGRRGEAFLMTKVCTHGRSADIAMKMLEESLRRLKTDYLDLWQIHAISYDNDPELAYAKGAFWRCWIRPMRKVNSPKLSTNQNRG